MRELSSRTRDVASGRRGQRDEGVRVRSVEEQVLTDGDAVIADVLGVPCLGRDRPLVEAEGQDHAHGKPPRTQGTAGSRSADLNQMCR